MKTPSHRNSEHSKTSATAIQVGPSPPIAPAVDNDAGALATSWPLSAQYVAATLFCAVLAILAADRLISQSKLRPTATLQSDHIDVNRATRSQLLQIPGIGQKTADNIVEHRKRSGPIASIDDMKKIDGIGAKTTKRLKKWLRATGDQKATTIKSPTNKTAKTLVNVNTANANELEALPRIGPKLAERIIAERAKQPYASIDDLARVYGIGKKTVQSLRPYVTVK